MPFVAVSGGVAGGRLLVSTAVVVATAAPVFVWACRETAVRQITAANKSEMSFMICERFKV